MALIELRATQRELSAKIDLLDRLSRRDELTGLSNRRDVMEALSREAALAARYGGDLSVILIDIDHFKSINDRFGHPVGDEVLRRLALTLSQGFRCVDTVGRYGGEEFMVVQPQTNFRGARASAEVLRQRIERMLFAELDHPVTVSCGIASLDINGGSVHALIAAADDALYRAKRQGRNRVVGADEEVEAPA